MRHVVVLLAAVFAAHAQSPSFEVATVKLAPPPDPQGTTVGTTGGPGTKEPGRWSAQNMTLQDLILIAYDIKPFQLSGPSWLNGDRFNIQARVPEGATRPRLRQMVQNLLAERFKLAAHRERKQSGAFRLVVAKNGPKLTESKPREPGAEAPKMGPVKMGADGVPQVPPGVPIMFSAHGVVTRQAVGETMAALASMLARQLGKPVTDATGLPGKYDFLLKWAGSGRGGSPATSPELGPDLMTALQEQLGLKLESAKGEVEILVVDRVEKTPTEN